MVSAIFGSHTWSKEHNPTVRYKNSEALIYSFLFNFYVILMRQERCLVQAYVFRKKFFHYKFWKSTLLLNSKAYCLLINLSLKDTCHLNFYQISSERILSIYSSFEPNIMKSRHFLLVVRLKDTMEKRIFYSSYSR